MQAEASSQRFVASSVHSIRSLSCLRCAVRSQVRIESEEIVMGGLWARSPLEHWSVFVWWKGLILFTAEARNDLGFNLKRWTPAERQGVVERYLQAVKRKRDGR